MIELASAGGKTGIFPPENWH